jgi:hypothetical protein
MQQAFQHIDVEQQDGCHCVRFRKLDMDEITLRDAFAELQRLVREQGVRRLALSLGPESPQCLYSIFLARLLSLQRALRTQGGQLLLCEASENVIGIFAACKLETLFHFLPDFAAARGWAG